MRGNVQKWHRYKTSDISEMKQSTANYYSVCRNSCSAYRLVTNLATYSELWPTFLGNKFLSQRISRTLFYRTLFVGAQ